MDSIAVVAIVAIVALAVVVLGIVAMLCRGLFRAWGTRSEAGDVALGVEVGQDPAARGD